MWYQLSVSGLQHQTLDHLACQFDDLGACSITLMDSQDNPIYEPALNTTPLWEQTVLIALFDNEQLSIAAVSWLQTNFAAAQIHTETLEDKIWEREWLKSFHPMQFGTRLWICPTHSTPPEPQAVNIRLDPGLAFGTGTHPTTALCLEFIDGYSAITNQTICDYGTGSGILALAALKLGAKKAYAVDIDPQAITATQQNALLNEIPAAQLTTGLVKEISLPIVDLMIANILAGPLVELAPTLLSHLKPNGIIIVSGLLEEQIPEIQKAYEAYVTNFNFKTKDGWALCSMQKAMS